MSENYRAGDSEHAKQRAIEERTHSNQQRLDEWGKVAVGLVVASLLAGMGWLINTTHNSSAAIDVMVAMQAADRRQIEDNTNRIVVIETTRYTEADAARDRAVLQAGLDDIKEWMRRLDSRLKDSGK